MSMDFNNYNRLLCWSKLFGFQAGTSAPGVQRIYDKASGADRFDMNHLLKTMRV